MFRLTVGGKVFGKHGNGPFRQYNFPLRIGVKKVQIFRFGGTTTRACQKGSSHINRRRIVHVLKNGFRFTQLVAQGL